jgi:predicted metal-dependent phosphoesterase TrpH
MLKVELHTHTADDPIDRIPYTAEELIECAVARQYDALAITLHERQLDIRRLRSYAADRGLVLIPGIEKSIEGRHVLLLNFPAGTEDVDTFDDLANLKRHHRGLVVAPHPFFPAVSCLRGMLDRHQDLFDAVEYNAMFTATLNFNRSAEQWAIDRGKPMVGNGDVHRLHQLGTTFSLVDADRDADSVCAAIAAGAVRVESTPLSWTDAILTVGQLFAADAIPRRWRQPAPQPAPAAR